MPPKSPNKTSRGSPGDESAKQDDGSERELMEKELVIAYMKSKLGRYQANGDRLQLENIKLGEDLDIQRLNLRDINEFLTNELKARSLTTNALEAKLYDLNHAMEEQRKAHEAAIAKLEKEKDKEIEAQADIITEFNKKAKIMQDHIDNKEKMDAEMASLKAEIQQLKVDHDHKLIDVDRQHIQDREKWKRETAAKIKETKIKMMKLTDNQLEMTTKRTIMENEQMSVELSYQSRQTEKLLSKNTVLVDENGDLRRQLGLSKQTEEELARRNNVYQRTIKSLLSKLDEQGTTQESNDSIVKELEDQSSEMGAQLSLLRLQLEEQQHQKQEVQNQLAAKNAEYDDLCNSYDTTAQFLIQCMEDVRVKLSTQANSKSTAADNLPGQHHMQPPHQPSHALSRSSSANSSAGPASTIGPLIEAQAKPSADMAVLPGRLDELTLEQRERVLAHLLERLHMQAAATTAAQIAPNNTSAPSSSPSGVILPPIPKYARRHNATTLPISQQLVPGPGLSHANTHLATYPNSTNYPYAHSQHVPASSQAGTSITAAAPPAASVPSPHSQQPLIAATEGGGPAPGSQVAAKLGAAGVPVNASWPQSLAAASGSTGPAAAAGGVRSSVGRAPMGAGSVSGGRQGALGGRHKAASGAASSHEGHSTLEVASQAPLDELENAEESKLAAEMMTGEELVSKVMSDVRPWGKRSPDVPTAATTSMNRKNGVFLKRGQR
ncbi:hypothetical protein DUNSADRAFT_2428 [Dunaliella salina]|uniref:Cilia- and flagella-associated protein 157 n=1 Tax=Dunaliella salina TaxID=3046 RepID=A0ABQ7GVN1_DUNSA|nr:hypothetical protein DUNSADRAFT_2428 [Dunaliella salina]|eukprot:KAF5838664.1 hypothetical protein DUNSADRAFT_2428 [Dunaliella salina]